MMMMVEVMIVMRLIRMAMMMIMVMMLMVLVNDVAHERVDDSYYLHATGDILDFITIQIHVTFWIILTCIMYCC